MRCNKCKNEAVPNSVLGKDFWYCRTCKEEVTLDTPSTQFGMYDDNYVAEFDQFFFPKNPDDSDSG